MHFVQALTKIRARFLSAGFGGGEEGLWKGVNYHPIAFPGELEGIPYYPTLDFGQDRRG